MTKTRMKQRAAMARVISRMVRRGCGGEGGRAKVGGGWGGIVFERFGV